MKRQRIQCKYELITKGRLGFAIRLRDVVPLCVKDAAVERSKLLEEAL